MSERAAQILFFHDEEHVPPQLLAHEADEPGRQVRIAINTRRVGQAFDDPAEPGR